ncbi:MAG TPA: hypothetical protein VFS37_06890 [Conexibacter sp.]|nr:hypothetical protein [Conexibacter sp.]
MLLAERIERPASLFGSPEPDPRTPAADAAAHQRDGLSGGPTLDEAIVGVWEGLAARVVVACPLCGGALRPQEASDAVGGRCGDCGTTLH